MTDVFSLFFNTPHSFGGGGGGGVTNAVGKGSVGAATGLSVSQDSVFAFDEDSPGGSNYRGDHQQHQKRQQTQKQMMVLYSVAYTDSLMTSIQTANHVFIYVE